ncbi:MAG: hypothetical protein IKJ42_11340, partial [Bacteroidaceae bacterium]|nr:hypothetical protein [Bacteroidaceae bacterium]
MNKKYMKWFWLSALFAPVLNSCSEDWDDHYENTQIVVNNPALQEVAQTSQEFLSERAEYGKMYDFLQEHQIFSKLEEKDLFHTMLVVKNDAFSLENVD